MSLLVCLFIVSRTINLLPRMFCWLASFQSDLHKFRLLECRFMRSWTTALHICVFYDALSLIFLKNELCDSLYLITSWNCKCELFLILMSEKDNCSCMMKLKIEESLRLYQRVDFSLLSILPNVQRLDECSM